MKNIIFFFVFIISGFVNAQNDKFEKLYQSFEDQKGVTTISINKAMFNMLGNMKLDAELENLDEIFQKVNSIKMIIIDDKDKVNLAAESLKKEIKKIGLVELMSINNDGNRVKFYTEDATEDTFKNVILNINSTDNILFMILNGDISAKDLNTIVQTSSK